MQFGICTTLDHAPAARAAGWDYIEESVQGLLQGEVSDDQWKGLEKAKASPLPIACANMLVPASLKITGPTADLVKLREYMSTVLKRAAMIGIETLVFGSAGARNVPEDFDQAHAWDQIAEFAHMSADLANKYKLTIVIEPLAAAESNIANTVAEAMKWVEAVNHPNFKCLVDSYHFWLEDEPLKNLEAAMPAIAHVHVADKAGRVAPGESGKSDYAPFLRVLKEGGYDRRISVEAPPFTEAQYGKVLEFLKEQWKDS